MCVAIDLVMRYDVSKCTTLPHRVPVNNSKAEERVLRAFGT